MSIPLLSQIEDRLLLIYKMLSPYTPFPYHPFIFYKSKFDKILKTMDDVIFTISNDNIAGISEEAKSVLNLECSSNNFKNVLLYKKYKDLSSMQDNLNLFGRRSSVSNIEKEYDSLIKLYGCTCIAPCKEKCNNKKLCINKSNISIDEIIEEATQEKNAVDSLSIEKKTEYIFHLKQLRRSKRKIDKFYIKEIERMKNTLGEENISDTLCNSTIYTKSSNSIKSLYFVLKNKEDLLCIEYYELLDRLEYLLDVLEKERELYKIVEMSQLRKRVNELEEDKKKMIAEIIKKKKKKVEEMCKALGLDVEEEVVKKIEEKKNLNKKTKNKSKESDLKENKNNLKENGSLNESKTSKIKDVSTDKKNMSNQGFEPSTTENITNPSSTILEQPSYISDGTSILDSEDPSTMEEVLDALFSLYSELYTRYKSYLCIHSLYQEYLSLREKHNEFEKRASDPKRLFRSSVRLLEEERERKRMKYKMDETEKEMEKKMKKYEEMYGEYK